MDNYGKKSLLELQKLLRDKGIRAHGRKAELVQRLGAWDSMTSGPSPTPDLPPPAPTPPWPSAASFRSLNTGMKDKLPTMSRQSFEQYVIYRQSCDKVPNNDVNAMKKGALLSEDRVCGMSYCQENSTHFFVGSVQAAMKKRVAYNIRGALHSSGEVIYSSCECPAGAGPHATCKHIVAGIFLYSFANTLYDLYQQT